MQRHQATGRAWAIRVGLASALVAAGLASVSSPSQAAASAPATPATGAAGGIITLNTTTANTFRNANLVDQVQAVQFTTAACTASSTTPATIPAVAARGVNDLVTYPATLVEVVGGTFTAADVGAAITGGTIPANTTITRVLDANRAIISAAATTEAANVQLNVGGSSRGGGTSVTHDGKKITSATANFQNPDASKAVWGTNIPANTTIQGNPTNSTTATISNAVTGTPVTGGALVIGPIAGPYNATSFTVVSDKKLVVEAPAALATVAAGTTYNVCVYNATVGSSGLAIATSTYKVYQAPTITGITPASGPALGGGQVVIGGTGFSTNTRVTIGGQALVSATVNAAAGTITGTMPSHAAGQVDVVVTSEGGPATMVNGYTYIDGISVTPSTTTTRGAVILDIFGAGFKASSLAWNNNALPTRSLGSVATSQIAVNNTITLAGHALANGDRVRFDGLTGAAPLESGKAYYVINSNTGAGTFEVAATPGGTAIDIQTVSSGGTARDISRLGLTPATGGGVGTFTVATGVVSALVGHTLEDGDRVMLSGFTGGLGGVSPWTWYYVNTADSATGTFKLAATRGGTALAFTATGATGTAMVWVPDELTHVIVSRGAYDDAATPGQPGWIAGECTNVQVISDTEIICKLDASTFAPTAGAHQITVIDDMRAGPTATSPGGPTRTTVVTSPSTFTFAPY